MNTLPPSVLGVIGFPALPALPTGPTDRRRRGSSCSLNAITGNGLRMRRNDLFEFDFLAKTDETAA
jgi:hypothetical protein